MEECFQGRLDIYFSLVLEAKVNTIKTCLIETNAAFEIFKTVDSQEENNSQQRWEWRMSYCVHPTSLSKHAYQVKSLPLSSELDRRTLRGDINGSTGQKRHHKETDVKSTEKVTHTTFRK